MKYDKLKDKYFWPQKSDVCWHYKGDILGIISNTTKVAWNRFKIKNSFLIFF